MQGRVKIRQLPRINARVAAEAALQPRVWPSGHTNDMDRLDALNGLDMQSVAPVESFDRVARLAAEMLKVPMVFVSFMEASRHWLNSRIGIDVTQATRELPFVGQRVLDQTLMIRDAREDARVADDPHVTGPPFIRGYMGVPLRTRSGITIGVLSAVDACPRAFSARDQENLLDFAKMLEQTLHALELTTATAGIRYIATEQERLFRDTFEQAAVGIAHATLNGRLVRVNKRLVGMLGYSAAELHEVSLRHITHPDDVVQAVAQFKQMVLGHLDEYRLEKRVLCKDGTYLWTNVSVAMKQASGGEPRYIIAVIEDIAEKKRIEEGLIKMRDSLHSQVVLQTARLKQRNAALRIQVKKATTSERAAKEAGRRFCAIADNLPALIGYWNRDLRCEFANEMHRQWYGREPQTIIGMHMRQLLGTKSYAAAEPYVRRALSGLAQRFESCILNSDGSESFQEIRYIPDVRAAEDIGGFFVLAVDSTQSRGIQRSLEAANARLASESATDYLTGLANRRAFSERCEQAARRYARGGKRYALLMLDLDDFKTINDRFGHDVGDEVLRATGQLLGRELRESRDVVARLGGEEFAVLCFGDLDEVLLRSVGERLRKLIENASIRVSNGRVRVTASIGIACSRPHDENWKSIYARADAALYAAKAAGKNRVAFDARGMISK